MDTTPEPPDTPQPHPPQQHSRQQHSAQQDPPRPSRWALSVGDLAQAAVFAALIAALGLIAPISLTSGIPITMQTLGVMLTGAILGPKKGTLAVVLFMILALAGLPILAGGRNGWTALNSPTGGFFLGFLPGVIVIGVLTAMMMPRYRVWLGILINILGGLVVIYAFGIGANVIRGTALGAAVSANTLFLPGDVIKATVAALVAAQVHRGRPGLIDPIRRRAATAG